MAMSPEQMKRLAELREKKALTLTPMFGLQDAVVIYLKKVGEDLAGMIAQKSGKATPVINVAPYARIYLSGYDEASDDDLDILDISFDWAHGTLIVTFFANPQVPTSKSWKISRIVALPTPRIAKLIYDSIP